MNNKPTAEFIAWLESEREDAIETADYHGIRAKAVDTTTEQREHEINQIEYQKKADTLQLIKDRLAEQQKVIDGLREAMLDACVQLNTAIEATVNIAISPNEKTWVPTWKIGVVSSALAKALQPKGVVKDA